MIEKTFLDRVSTYPNRIKLTPVSGQADTYDMTRADAPRVEGTPLDKTTFDSIIHSRLTGRYYVPTLTRKPSTANFGLTVSPLPTSGWVFDESTSRRATNGTYVVEASSDQAAYSLADEVFTSGGWQSGSNSSEAWISIYHPQGILVHKMSFKLEAQYNARIASVVIEGTRDPSAWTTLYTTNSPTLGSVVTYALTTTDTFTHYRLRFVFSDSNRVTVSSWKYTLYDIPTYTNAFTVAEGLPTSWTDGQRITTYIGAVNTFAVIANTLNGVGISTILQPSKYYELIYISSISQFVAREA